MNEKLKSLPKMLSYHLAASQFSILLFVIYQRIQIYLNLQKEQNHIQILTLFLTV